MRNSKLTVTKHFLVLALTFCFLNSQGASKVLIKANVLLGERFVTVKSNTKEIENKAAEVFTKKGYDIVTKMQPDGEILLVDLFLYQFPAQYPVVTITIRTQNGIHYIDQENRKVFVDRDLTNLSLVTELAERIPVEINTDMVYRVGIGDIISSAGTSSSGLLSSSPLYAGNSDYYSTIKWKDDTTVPFIVPSDLGLYLLFASNFKGFKKQLAKGPIVLKLRINDTARFELVDINSHLDLDVDQKIRIKEFIDSFPLWVTNIEVENIEVIYGLK